MTKIQLHHVAYAVLALVAGGCLQAIYWEIFPRFVFQFNRRLEVHPYGDPKGSSIKQSQYLDITMDYCKRPGVEPAEVFISFTDDLQLDVPGSVLSIIPSGCHVVHELLWVPNLPSGMYTISMTRIYHANPIRNVSITSRSNVIRVEGVKDEVMELENRIETLDKEMKESIKRAWREVQ